MATTHTEIAWTDSTWNPVRGCARVSDGCAKCYAIGQAHRFAGPGQPYEGLTVVRPQTATRPGVDWSGKVRLVPEALGVPLKWRKPRKVFVNSMSDLFHPGLSNEEIAAVFGVMAACPQHTFQILTKRPERAAKWFEWVNRGYARDFLPNQLGALQSAMGWFIGGAPKELQIRSKAWERATEVVLEADAWPLRNCWLGVSIEDQKRADERIPWLLQCPASVRFISAEPLLGPLDLRCIVHCQSNYKSDAIPCGAPEEPLRIDALTGLTRDGEEMFSVERLEYPRIDQVIVGGESGRGARPFDLSWARSLRDQCRAAGAAFFYKQSGSQHACEHSSKGGCLECIPEDLRVREFPQ